MNKIKFRTRKFVPNSSLPYKPPVHKDNVLIILGPTATGKTDLAIHLAKQFNGELVACDSRQVYRGLDIGTGKFPSGIFQVLTSNFQWSVDGIPIHMYDVADPQIQYTVKDYVVQSKKIIQGIIKQGKLPIIVGGTGLYLKALLEGLPNLAFPIDPHLREELKELSVGDLQIRLHKLSKDKWDQMNYSDRNNPRRLQRYIEIASMNPYTNYKIESDGISSQYKILKIGLTAPRPILNQRIDQRLDSRIDQGLIKEVRTLLENGLSLERMKQLGLEYKYLALHLEGVLTKMEMIFQLKLKIHQYAKRQLIWFKKDIDINWFEITVPSWQKQVELTVQNWYHSTHDKKS